VSLGWWLVSSEHISVAFASSITSPSPLTPTSQLSLRSLAYDSIGPTGYFSILPLIGILI
jgi:hypothetical protein